MSPFLHLHLRRLLRRPLRLAMSVVAIAVGTTLTIALLAVSASITRGAEIASGGATGADLVVSGTSLTGFPSRLVDDIATTSGVAGVAPLLRQQAAVDGRPATLLGVDAGAARLAALPLDCVEPTGPPRLRGVVTGPALTAGPMVSVAAGAGPRWDVPVNGSLRCPGAHDLEQGAFVLTDLATAQLLSGRQRTVDLVLVRLLPGASSSAVAERLEAAFGGAVVVGTPAQVAQRFSGGVLAIRSLLQLITTLGAVVAAFLVFNTFSMLTLERRQEIATYRALGGARSAIVVRIMGEAVVVGAAGAALGAVAGAVSNRWIVSRIPDVLVASVGARPVAVLPTSAIAIGVATGILAAVAGALVPALTATRTPPAVALHPPNGIEGGGAGGRDHPVVAAVGVAGFCAFSAIGILGRGSAPVIATPVVQLCFVVTTLAVAPSIARAAAGSVGWIRGIGPLAAEATRRAPRRAWGTTVVVGLGVGMVVISAGAVRDQDRAFARTARFVADTDLYVQTGHFGDIPLERTLPAYLADRISAMPGVTDVVKGQATYVTIGDQRVMIEAFDGASSYPLTTHARPSAVRAMVAGDGAVVNRRFAELHDLEIGSSLDLDTPTGPARLPVLDVVTTFDLGGGTVGVSLDWFEQHFGRAGATWLEVHLADRGRRADYLSDLERLVDPLDGVSTGTGDEQLARSLEMAGNTSGVLVAVTLLIACCAAIAVANTMSLAVVQRQRELGVHRALGARRTALAATVAAESLALTAIGAGLGVTVGMIGHRMATNVVGTFLGTPVPYHAYPSVLVLGGVAALGMATIGAVLPAWRVARITVVQAIAYE